MEQKKLSNLVAFTMLGLELNSLIDMGKSVPVDEIVDKCEDYSLIAWLNENTPKTISLWDRETKIIMAEEFASIANAVNYENKFSIYNNGIALLIAYCFVFIQNPPTRNVSDCSYAERKLKQIGSI